MIESTRNTQCIWEYSTICRYRKCHHQFLYVLPMLYNIPTDKKGDDNGEQHNAKGYVKKIFLRSVMYMSVHLSIYPSIRRHVWCHSKKWCDVSIEFYWEQTKKRDIDGTGILQSKDETRANHAHINTIILRKCGYIFFMLVVE